MILSEIKTYVVVMSFYMKMMKQRTLQPYSLRHSIKKDMFSVLGKLDLFKSSRGGVLFGVSSLTGWPATLASLLFQNS